MKKYNDEELQKLIFETKDPVDYLKEVEDAEYYHLIKEELGKEPGFSLPQDFALQVTQKAIRRKRLKMVYKSSVLMLSSLLLLAFAGCVAFYFLAKEMFISIIGAVETFRYPFIFGVVVFILIQLLDEFLIYGRGEKKIRG